METNQTLNFKTLITAFENIYNQFEPENISVIEQEMRKVVPCAQSTVSLGSGANFTDKRITMDIFITNPLPAENTANLTFVEIINLWLQYTDFKELKIIAEHVNYLQNYKGNHYFIDAVPVFYNKQIEKYYFHFVIIKKNKKNGKQKA